MQPSQLVPRNTPLHRDIPELNQLASYLFNLQTLTSNSKVRPKLSFTQVAIHHPLYQNDSLNFRALVD